MPTEFPRYHTTAAQAAGESADPKLLYTSDALGWGGLTARLYHEPQRMELWHPPTVPVLTIGLVTSGMMHLEQRNSASPWHGQAVQREQLFLQSYHEPYELRWHGGRDLPIQTLVLKLHQQFLQRSIEAITECDPAQLLFMERIGFADPLLLQLGRALQHELEQPTAVGALYAQTAAQMIAVHLLRHYSSAEVRVWESARGLTKRQLQRVKDFVQSQLEAELTLDVLAQQAQLSAYHFARMFRQSTGESPHQFVLRQRLERAQWLLRTTNTPLAAVASACGFGTQSYMTTVFRQRLGLTPGSYRRQASG